MSKIHECETCGKSFREARDLASRRGPLVRGCHLVTFGRAAYAIGCAIGFAAGFLLRPWDR